MSVSRCFLERAGRKKIAASRSQSAQGFEPHDEAGVQPQDRLVVRLDTIFGQGFRDITDRGAPARNPRADARPVANEAATACLLRMVERKIGRFSDARRRAFGLAQCRAADGRARYDGVSVAVRRHLKLVEYAFGRSIQVGDICRLLEDDRELVASYPIGDVRRHRASDTRRGGTDQSVARQMPERVVDDLEVVEVDDEQCPRPDIVAAKLSHRAVIGCPVGQTGQRIDIRSTIPIERTLVSAEGCLAELHAGFSHLSLDIRDLTRAVKIEVHHR